MPGPHQPARIPSALQLHAGSAPFLKAHGSSLQSHADYFAFLQALGFELPFVEELQSQSQQTALQALHIHQEPAALSYGILQVLHLELKIYVLRGLPLKNLFSTELKYQACLE